MDIKISGFSDEIDDSLDRQIEVVRTLGMSYISIRGVDGKNIGDYSVGEFQRDILPRLVNSGVSISSFGSPIGKVFIDDEEGFEKQLTVLENICEMCKLSNCKYIRMFSFFIKKGENFNNYKSEVVTKLQKFIEIARKHDIILLHENEKDIFGDTAKRCKVLFDEVGCAHFKAIFDFANFVQCGEDTQAAYNLLREHIEYIHIKDAAYDVSYNVLCGTGDGKIPEILKQAIKGGYKGFLTLEPHLAMFGSLQSLELDDAAEVVNTEANITGEEGYKMQYEALEKILSSMLL